MTRRRAMRRPQAEGELPSQRSWLCRAGPASGLTSGLWTSATRASKVSHAYYIYIFYLMHSTFYTLSCSNGFHSRPEVVTWSVSFL